MKKKNSTPDNTPRLATRDAKLHYIDSHLFNELRYLLPAATEWSIQHQLELRIVGYEVQVYAMDSAFLHARTLFEFFLKETSRNHYGWDEFLDRKLSSPKYERWSDPLHRHVMHAQTRSQSQQLESFCGGARKDLNAMPVDFALEILRLWKEFEQRLISGNGHGDKDLGELAKEKRRLAVAAADNVVKSDIAKRHATDKRQVLNPVFEFD
jgi:hypothetical protein